MPPTSALDAVRLDIWLDVSCLFRTRSEAQKACKLGRLTVNGQPAKPHRLLHPGDRIAIRRPSARVQQVVVRGLADRHVPKADARQLYADVTPAPDEKEVEIRRLDRMYHAATTPLRSPDKRERRALGRLKRND